MFFFAAHVYLRLKYNRRTYLYAAYAGGKVERKVYLVFAVYRAADRRELYVHYVTVKLVLAATILRYELGRKIEQRQFRFGRVELGRSEERRVGKECL